MKPADQLQLKRILASFDEAGFVALSNKGLVRRAQKDLETGGLRVEEGDDELVVRGVGWTVWMPAGGPSHARDDTRASGVTRQILAAAMFLRDRWSPASTAACSTATAESAPKRGRKSKAAKAPREGEHLHNALLDLTMDDLEKWAGKTLLREILAVMPDNLHLEVELHVGLTLRLPEHDVELRLLPASEKKTRLLDRMLSTAPKALHERWVLTAVLGLLRKHGKNIQPPEETTAESGSAVRTRPALLQATVQVLESMLTTGIAHPSPRMIERLFTLSITATAVHLPRLSHLLRMLADEVSRILNRNAAADTQRLFDSMSLTYALARALQLAGDKPPRELAGVQRSQYDPCGDLALTGMAAYPWQTASGFEGLTLLFWEEARQRFLSWSTSRPTSNPGRLNLENVYRHEATWAGGGSPARLSRSRFILRGARTNPVGRLSGSQQSSVIKVLPGNPEALDMGTRLFRSWHDLSGYAAAQYPIGLRLHNPLDQTVVLEPAGWGERFFDEMQQTFCWPLTDTAGQVLLLTQQWNGPNESAIEFLEAVKPERHGLTRVVARMLFPGLGFAVEPLAFLGGGVSQFEQVLNPAFDYGLIESRQSGLLSRLRKKFGRDRVPTTMTPDDEWEALSPATASLGSTPSGIRNMLREAEELLLQIAEVGAQRLTDTKRRRVQDLATKISNGGFLEFSRGLEAFLSESPLAGSVLWANYLCRLCWQALGSVGGLAG
jgi:hypothetical protein